MVNMKFYALYTDNLGCEQAEVYFSKYGLELKVRNCIFKDDNFNFDFYSDDPNKVRKTFYLKDNELIEYFIDIKLPLILIYNNKECVEKFLLRIERHKNYYNNSLSLYCNGIVYMTKGYNLKELFSNMKKELPKEYDMSSALSCMFENNYIKTNKENISYRFKDSKFGWRPILSKKIYLNLLNRKHKKHIKILKRVPIMYISNKCCLN
jgi:hypothetical protein